MKRPLKRIVIYTKDVENITGLRSQAARKLLNEIRQSLGKREKEFVTVSEFCSCTGLAEEKVLPFLDI